VGLPGRGVDWAITWRGTAIARPRRAQAAIHPSLSWISQIRVRSEAVTAHGFGARSRLSVIPPTRVRGRAKRRMYARCRIQPHAAQQISFGGEQSVRAAPTLLLRTAPWAHKGSTNAFRSHRIWAHVDTARANRSADRREILAIELHEVEAPDAEDLLSIIAGVQRTEIGRAAH
jgi:hypothetical protein